MRFRFRYSLLTLLILTALVAGGVKWWHGPHRAVMSDPRTNEETLLSMNLLYCDLYPQVYPPVVYEYEYLNEWNRRKYLFVKGYSTSKEPIPVWVHGKNLEPPGYNLRYPNLPEEWNHVKVGEETGEQVVCWLYEVTHNHGYFNYAPPKTPADWMQLKIFDTSKGYILTTKKQLYYGGNNHIWGLELYPAKLNEITNPEFRQRIAEELAKIPNPK